MSGEQDDNWLKHARLIDRLVREEMQRQGLEIVNAKPFDELVASGDLKAAECRVLSMNMVTPGWCESVCSNPKDKY